MTDSKGGKLSAAAARNLGEYRESWCAVETKKDQSWDRKVRKHYPRQFSSTVFEEPRPGYEPRCTTFRVDAPTHRERRHFKERYDCQVKI